MPIRRVFPLAQSSRCAKWRLNKEETYTILGAWDGDPDRHIISYQTAIGQALLGHEIGETISLNTEHDSAQFTIVSIQRRAAGSGRSNACPPSESAVETAMPRARRGHQRISPKSFRILQLATRC